MPAKVSRLDIFGLGQVHTVLVIVGVNIFRTDNISYDMRSLCLANFFATTRKDSRSVSANARTGVCPKTDRSLGQLFENMSLDCCLFHPLPSPALALDR